MYSGFIREKRITTRHEKAVYGKISKLHWPLIIIVTLLSIIGFAMLYSAAGGNFEPWANQQMVRFLMGFVAMMFVAVIDIKYWYRFAYLIYGFGVFLLILVEIMGYIGMGAQRWLSLGPLNIQPSEFMKMFLVLAMAKYFHSLHHNEMDSLKRMILPAVLIAVPAVLILKQPNLGTATILGLTGVSILFITGLGYRRFIIAGLIVLAIIPFAWNHLHDYQKQRVHTFLNPDSDPLGAGYNIIQSKIAIGSGGFYGKGFMEGSQGQLDFLPEKQTDFIFTMLAEEFGFLGGATVIMLYTMLILLCLRVGMQSENHFGRIISSGVAFILFIHLFINTAMVMGLIPVVGVPLPLLSYGGSIMLAILICFGFVMNAHIYRERNTI